MGRLIYDRCGIIIHEEESTRDEKNMVRFMMKKLGEELDAERKYNHQHQCPHCHIVEPRSRKCDCQD